ncbi:MAG: PQQ-binding-like beta-propeller repeat protein [Armatimonadetes bacterium]|nr:PQQ-binding-like beta-propeller repeat protein [Armatimonadota bacterium]
MLAQRGTLYAVRTDGTEFTSVNLGSPINGTPCVADGRVYVGTADGVLHVRYAQTLQSDWNKTFSGESITGGVTVWNGAAYVGTVLGTGELHTIDLSTHQDRANSPAATPYSIDYTTPAIDANFSLGARCYVSDYSCWVTAAQCSDGLWKWKWERDGASFFSSPTVCGEHIFVGSHVNGMYRITDGDTAAQEPNPYMYTGAGSFIDSTAAAWNGKLYFGCSSGKVCRIDATTFTTAEWTTPNLGSPVTSSPLISTPTGLLFGSTTNGYLFALNTSSGTEAWHYDLRDSQQGNWSDAQVLSSPAASGGNLYIVAGDANQRRLYCFGP